MQGYGTRYRLSTFKWHNSTLSNNKHYGDGTTIIKIHGKFGTEIEYKAKFSNSITLDDGSGWLLKDGKIYSLEVKSQTQPTQLQNFKIPETK